MASEDKPKVSIYSNGLNKVIQQMTFWHKIHGVLVLTDESSHTKTSIALKIVMRVLAFLFAVTVLIGSLAKFSSNNQFQRIQSYAGFVGILLILLQMFLIWLKRKHCYEIVNWCHWLETRPQKFCKTPKNWFVRTQNQVSKVTL